MSRFLKTFTKLFTVASLVIVCASGSLATVQADSRYFCGSKCNNKSALWVNPANGVQCSNSKKLVNQGYPKGYNSYDGGKGTDDPKMVVKVYYSTVCQTLWATVTNNGSSADINGNCGLYNKSTQAKYSNVYISATCPAKGKTASVHMIDDHSSTYKKVATIEFDEPHGPGYASYQFSY